MNIQEKKYIVQKLLSGILSDEEKALFCLSSL